MYNKENKTSRYIMTPDGITEIDFVTDTDTVWVWLGKRDLKSNEVRTHKVYPFEQCEEIE